MTASMIEARSAETARLGPQGESMVPQAGAIACYACFCGYQLEQKEPCRDCGKEMHQWSTRQRFVFKQSTTTGERV